MWLPLVFTLIICVSGNEYYVEITDDGPVVVGASVTFSANLYVKGGTQPSGTFKYKWRDNINPQHRAEFTTNAQSNWTVAYPPGSYPNGYRPGSYKVEVEVFTPTIIIDWPECSARKSFTLTNLLNGDMALKQNGTSSPSDYISNATEVLHSIELHKPDATYLKNSSIATYWYLDCNYVGKTDGLIFKYNYSTSDVTHIIDALVVVPHESAPDLPSTTAAQISAAESSTEIYLINSTKTNDIKSNNIADASNDTKLSYLTLNNSTTDNSTKLPVIYECAKKTFSPILNNYSYGLFSRKIKVKAPVSNLKVEGINWLQHGEMLNLQVYCNGSAPFDYCVQFWNGNHTVVGNESCIANKMFLSSCNFQIFHYFGNSTNYTVVIIVENDVQKVVRGVNVNVYEVTKHAQLSVIIVPISAGIIAVILIIFGIAYYVQSRNRYIVEVADFDFSNASDMEYKTFRERLVEAVSNAFNKTEDYSEQDSNNGVPASKKYGSMQ